MERELATQRADLPHGFDDTGVGRHCAVCGERQGHRLHEPLSPLEMAAAQPQRVLLERELGS